MNGTVAYVLARKYVQDTAAKLGAVKGAPCKIKATTKTDEFYIITFEWKDEAGVSHTSELKIDNLGKLVEANPAEEATAKLQTIKIGDVVYSIPKDVEPIIMSYEDYLALTPEEVNDGQVRYVYDYPYGAGGEGGSGSLAAQLISNKTVGGINSGKTYAQGTTLEQILRDMLSPVLYPTLTGPSVSIAIPGDKILEKGATKNATLTATFSQGSISPAYGTNGKRAGAATSYALNGGTAQSGNTFSVAISESNKTFKVVTTYEAGPQPKDSAGNDYSSPLAAGSVESNTITYEFVDALWANTANISTVAKLALVSKSAKQKQFDFPAAPAANPETFDVPADWTVTAVEVLNTLSNQWETAVNEFTVTDETHGAVNYKRYTCNLGYALGARSIRIKWN